ncbi:hypothetical protein DB88DRAFT_490232 [Papiliotrema laurentii]|uniref:Uncharacterized protein n=1 Tax=Papiliotrema laurentii TaxID=5418 RepID=A0AAD9CYL6_PAPLA|nr:hypothetical protein DB88DRAFT_490232 [Papiliotrema laurentii]
MSVFRKFVPVETYPIIGIVAVAVAGAGTYLYKLSQGPEVVWDRSGDWRPWDKVKYDQNLKYLAINREFWNKRKEEALTRTNERYVDSI